VSPQRRILCIVLAGAAAALMFASGCGRDGGSVRPSESPSGRPDITGIVWQATGAEGSGSLGTLLVVAQHGVPSAYDRASVNATSATTWLDVEGDDIEIPPLEQLAGRRVAVTFSGPVRESYPVQADAGTVRVLEPVTVEMDEVPAGLPSVEGTAVELVRDADDALTAVRILGADGRLQDLRLDEHTVLLLETPTELKGVEGMPLIGNGIEPRVTSRVEDDETLWIVLRLP
jgi:hypothetical protein